MIRSEDVAFWRSLADELSKLRPNPGKLVQIRAGKHKGELGTVIRHQISKFSSAFRYGGDANLQMREMAGRQGFCCLVAVTSGEQHWVDADKLIVEVTS